MRPFDYTEKWEKLLTPEIVGYLTTIHEYKGEQRLIAERHADVLESLVEVAKIQSTESSNKIEGIYTSDDRYTSVAYWYQTLPSAPLMPLPTDAEMCMR